MSLHQIYSPWNSHMPTNRNLPRLQNRQVWSPRGWLSGHQPRKVKPSTRYPSLCKPLEANFITAILKLIWQFVTNFAIVY